MYRIIASPPLLKNNSTPESTPTIGCLSTILVYSDKLVNLLPTRVFTLDMLDGTMYATVSYCPMALVPGIISKFTLTTLSILTIYLLLVSSH